MRSRLALPSRRQRPRSRYRRNLTLQVLGVGGVNMALQFGSPEVVLPWVGHHLGVAYIVVAMLVPLVNAGYITSQLSLAALIGHVPLRKYGLIVAGVVLAAVFGLIFVATRVSPVGAALALLAFSVLFGLGFGAFMLSSNDLIGKTVPGQLHGRLLARGAAVGGVVTLGAVFALSMLMPAVAGNHIVLVWLAAGAWLGAVFVYAGVLEEPSRPQTSQSDAVSLRKSWHLIGKLPWYRHLLVLRVLLLSVELGITFYAIHAATLHGPTVQSLCGFVVAMSLGLVLGGPVWGRLVDHHNALALIIAATLAAASGVVVLIMDALGQPGGPFVHGLLFLPLSLAAEGSYQGRTRALLSRASERGRPTLIALGSALMAAAGVVVALVLGLVGHLHDIRTPLVILILLNIAAALYVPHALAAKAD